MKTTSTLNPSVPLCVYAAAPEMLEALKAQTRVLDSLCHAVFNVKASHAALVDPRGSEPMRHARAAIAKAEGKEGGK